MKMSASKGRIIVKDRHANVIKGRFCFTKKQYKRIKERFNNGATYADIMRDYDLARETIRKIRRSLNYEDYGTKADENNAKIRMKNQDSVSGPVEVTYKVDRKYTVLFFIAIFLWFVGIISILVYEYNSGM